MTTWACVAFNNTGLLVFIRPKQLKENCSASARHDFASQQVSVNSKWIDLLIIQYPDVLHTWWSSLTNKWPQHVECHNICSVKKPVVWRTPAGIFIMPYYWYVMSFCLFYMVPTHSSTCAVPNRRHHQTLCAPLPISEIDEWTGQRQS